MIANTPFWIADVEVAWNLIVDKLWRTRSPLEWLDAARRKCGTGEAVCLGCDDGVVLVELQADERMRAVILLAVSIHGNHAFRRHEAALVRIAQDMGAQELAFRSDRKGWERLLGPHWQHQDGTYSRSV